MMCAAFKNLHILAIAYRWHDKAVICAPDFYWSPLVQREIKRVTLLDNNQWIYELSSAGDEEILHDTEDWLLAKDKHPGTDERWLIIYKDRHLRTIRDLRAQHISMLSDSVEQTRLILADKKPQDTMWSIFFHYYPSVFQLHAHVMTAPLTRNTDRIHDVCHVLRNLNKNTHWYRDALILTKPSRFYNLLLANQSPFCSSKWSFFFKSHMRIELIARQAGDPVKTKRTFSTRRKPDLPDTVSPSTQQYGHGTG